MGVIESSPLKGNTPPYANSVSKCPTNDLQNSCRTSDTYQVKNISPIELDKEIIKKIVKHSHRNKQKNRPIIHYRPLFSWDPKAIPNENCGKGKKDTIVKKKPMFQPQSSFRFQAARNSLPTVGHETPKSASNQILQQNENAKYNPFTTSKQTISKLDLQPLSIQLPFSENQSPQTNFELLMVNSAKTSLRPELTKGVKSLYFDFKSAKKPMVNDRGLMHTRAQSKVYNEITPLSTRRPTMHSRIDRQRRSSLLKEDTVLTSITRLKCMAEDKDLPRIKRMNAFVDKEETKANEAITANEENIKNTESIAFVLREQHKKREKEKKLKNITKDGSKFTSKAEKKRLWIGGNGKFDSARLKSWYNKMNGFL